MGVLTSGGDAPGMNAAIRAVTRASIFNGWKVMGIYRGYEGLINNEITEFTSQFVSNTIQRGGTILKTARSEEDKWPPSEAFKCLLEVFFVCSEYVIQEADRNDFGLSVERDGPHAADKVIFYFQRVVKYNSSDAGSQH